MPKRKRFTHITMRDLGKKLKNQSGLALIDIMLIVIVLGAAAIILAYRLARETTEVRPVAPNSCQARAEAIIDSYRSEKWPLRPSNWHPLSEQTLIPPPVPPFNTPNSFPIFTETASHEITSDLVNTWQLIGGPANRALYLYNLPGYCTFNNLGKLVDSPEGPALKNERVFLNINRLDLQTRQSDCSTVGTQKLAATTPLNSVGAFSKDKVLGINKGLRVTATVEFLKNDGTPGRCQASVVVSNKDTHGAPKFIKPPPDLMGLYSHLTPADQSGTLFLANLGANNIHPFVDPHYFPEFPLACDTGGVAVIAAVDKPATAFLCSPLYYQRTKEAITAQYRIGQFTSCLSLSATASDGARVTGGIYQVHHGEPSDQTAVVISFSKVQEGFYTFFIKAVDDAQASSEVKKITFGVDNSRPQLVTVRPPSTDPQNLINVFNGGQRGSVDVDESEDVLKALNFGPSYFQCAPGGNDFFWIAVIKETGLSVTPTGAYWYFDQKPYNGNPYPASQQRCSKIVSTPNEPALPNQSIHTMSVEACDLCGGTGALAAPINWWVDYGPAPRVLHDESKELKTMTMAGAAHSFDFYIGTSKKTPERMICENVDHHLTDSSQTCSPQGYNNQPCTENGSRGFCTKIFDGCGRSIVSPIVHYRVLGQLGQNCATVPCQRGLVCALDHSTARGSCVTPQTCTQDSDCGNNPGPSGSICFLRPAATSGLCHGLGPGPGVVSEVPESLACPDLVRVCESLAAYSTARCKPACPCSARTFYNEACTDTCDNADACAGTREVVAPAPVSSVSPKVFLPNAIASPPPADINTPPMADSPPPLTTVLDAGPPPTVAPVAVPTFSETSQISNAPMSAPSPVLPQASPLGNNFNSLPSLH